uniref:Uncharacterized protein n=1 Tax=uncultured marine virus TaxID=186617 RepID=A0A0F7L712_9VIRU|nr:hypothetical protein [uncultured marine virus]
MNQPKEGWEALNRKDTAPTEKEIQAAKEKDRQFNLDLHKTFNTAPGKKVLAHFKRLTIDRRIDLILTNPMTGQKYPNPQEAIFARVGEENFIKDILTRIERAKK